MENTVGLMQKPQPYSAGMKHTVKIYSIGPFLIF